MALGRIREGWKNSNPVLTDWLRGMDVMAPPRLKDYVAQRAYEDKVIVSIKENGPHLVCQVKKFAPRRVTSYIIPEADQPYTVVSLYQGALYGAPEKNADDWDPQSYEQLMEAAEVWHYFRTRGSIVCETNPFGPGAPIPRPTDFPIHTEPGVSK